MIDKNRPSLLVGDFILVRRVEAQKKDKWIQGSVHNIDYTLRYIDVRFGDDFNLYNATKFNVRFVLNRLPFRRSHGALEKPVKGQERVIFPDVKHIRGKRYIDQTRLDEMVGKLSNPQIASDEEQLAAVTSIVNAPPGTVPFVIFGP